MAFLDETRAKIEQKQIRVFACNPRDYMKIKSNKKDLPFCVIVYPNEHCKVGEMDEADLSDLNMKQFIFDFVLPKGVFVMGESESSEFKPSES